MVMCSLKACTSVALLLVLALFASETNAQSSDAPVAAAAEPSAATDGAAAAQPTVDLGYARYKPTAINVSLLQDSFSRSNGLRQYWDRLCESQVY